MNGPGRPICAIFSGCTKEAVGRIYHEDGMMSDPLCSEHLWAHTNDLNFVRYLQAIGFCTQFEEDAEKARIALLDELNEECTMCGYTSAIFRFGTICPACQQKELDEEIVIIRRKYTKGALQVGMRFDTHYEQDCEVSTEVDGMGNFDAFDSEGVLCGFHVTMISFIYLRG